TTLWISTQSSTQRSLPMSDTTNTNAKKDPKKDPKRFGPVFSNEADLRAFPQPEGTRPYRITANNKTVFSYPPSASLAVRRPAKALGIVATLLDGSVTKDKVADQLAQLSDEDRAALLTKYLPPAPERAPKTKK